MIESEESRDKTLKSVKLVVSKNIANYIVSMRAQQASLTGLPIADVRRIEADVLFDLAMTALRFVSHEDIDGDLSLVDQAFDQVCDFFDAKHLKRNHPALADDCIFFKRSQIAFRDVSKNTFEELYGGSSHLTLLQQRRLEAGFDVGNCCTRLWVSLHGELHSRLETSDCGYIDDLLSSMFMNYAIYSMLRRRGFGPVEMVDLMVKVQKVVDEEEVG